MESIFNDKTGDRLFLVNNQWVPPSQTAENEFGQKAYLINNQWITDKDLNASKSTGLGDVAKLLGAGALPSVTGIPEGAQAGLAQTGKSLLSAPMDFLNLMANPTALSKKITSALVPGAGLPDIFPKEITEKQLVPTKDLNTKVDELITKGKIPQFRELAIWGQEKSKQIEDSLSPQMKDEMASSQPTGDIMKAIQTGDYSQLSLGKDPSALGYFGQAVKVLGSGAPLLASALITKSVPLGTGLGFTSAASEGISNARDHINSMNDVELSKNSEYFRNLVAMGTHPKLARRMTEDKAGDLAASAQGIVGAFGGNFTTKLLTGGFSKVLPQIKNKIARGMGMAAAGSAEEGVQEYFEGIASDLGIDKTVVRDIGTDSFANLVLGALGGIGPGAVSAFTQPKTQAPPVQGAPTEDEIKRFKELNDITSGTKKRTYTGADGQKVTIPARDPRYFTPEEQQEYQQLKGRLEPTKQEPTLSPVVPPVVPPVTPPTGEINTVKPINPDVQQLIDQGLVSEEDLDEIQGIISPKQPTVPTAPVVPPVATAPVSPPVSIVAAFPMGENTEFQVMQNDKGFIANLYDKDSGQYLDTSKVFPTETFGEGARDKAIEFAKAESEKAAKYNAPEEIDPELKQRALLRVDQFNTGEAEINGRNVNPLARDLDVEVGANPQETLSNIKDKLGLPKEIVPPVETPVKPQAEINKERQAAQRAKTTGELPKRSSAENIPTLGVDDRLDSSNLEVVNNVNNILKDYKTESGQSIEGNYLNAVSKDLKDKSEEFQSPPIDKNREVPTATISVSPFNRGYVAGSTYTGKDGGYASGISATGTIYETRLDAIEAEKAKIRKQAEKDKNTVALKWLDSLPTDATKPQPKTQAEINQERQATQKTKVVEEAKNTLTPEDIAFAGQILKNGNGIEYKDAAKPVLKKLEQAGLINQKNGKVYVSPEATAAGIKNGDFFSPFADSSDMGLLKEFLSPKPVAPVSPAVSPAVSPNTNLTPQLTAEEQADKDLMDALGELSWMAGKTGRINMMPEEEQRLMPTLIKLMDAAFRKGYHTFKQAAKFVRDLIRKTFGKEASDRINLNHLQGSYIAMSGNYPEQSTPIAEVAGVKSIEEIEEEVKAEKPAEIKADLGTVDGKFKIAQAISQYFIAGNGFGTIIEARKFISDMTGVKIEAGTLQAKQADEAIEVGVVLAAQDIAQNTKMTADAYDKLVDLYNRQPNLAVRSSTSVREQAYSTPAPLAFVASKLAGITDSTTVYEPTAGNGMLLIDANPKKVIANELNSSRFEMLKKVLSGAKVTNENGVKVTPSTVDVVIENPPFGSIGEDFNIDGFKTREIDHAIVMKSLQSMRSNGRAVLIVGSVQSNTEEGRREGYRSASKRNFYVNLYKDYNVVDHFTIAGDMYSKQGASYPVDVIVINGKWESKNLRFTLPKRSLPAGDLPQIIENYEQLKEKLNESSMVSGKNISTSGTNISEPTGRGGESERLGERPSGEGNEPSAGRKEPTGSSGQGVSEVGPTKRGQPEPAGTGVSEGQPKPVNKPELTDDGRPVSSTAKGEQPRGGASDTGNEPRGLGEPSTDTGIPIESRLKDRRGEEIETENQVSYTPHSQAAAVGTLAPRAMAQSIDQSLTKLETQFGDIDEYVAEALQMDLETLKEKFSAEQIDALALAINNAEAGKGFIIGDQTGVGKGRVVAGMIKYALLNGKTPIFMTEKPNLYSDMIRDLDDIGMTDELALESNNPKIIITNNNEPVPYTLIRQVNGDPVEKDFILKAPEKDEKKSGYKLTALFKKLRADDSLGRYKVIFTNYSQTQMVKKAPTERQAFLNHFGNDGYLILDESHNAGGTSKKSKSEDEGTGRSSFIREMVNNSFGSFFSSATYAKSPDVMDLYSSTDMGLAVDNISELGEAIKNGGIPMQQIVANMLTQVGQYIRRERTFAGVSYNTVETKVDKATAENMATSMRDILSFSREKEKAVDEIKKELDKRGSIAKGVSEKTQIQAANFGSTMHNLIDQMLLSLKAQDSVKHAVESLKRGEQVVLTVSNTMGSFLEQYADEMGLKTGDPVNLSFKDLYLKYLEKQRTITIKPPGAVKKEDFQSYRLTDQDLGPTLTEQYNAIKTFINNAGFGSAPMSPIDYMHSELRKQGYQTGEITGRTITLNYESGTPLLMSRSSSIKERVNSVKAFNNGDIRVIILNQAGSTGLSLHAKKGLKNTNKRHMIIVQAEKNIDTHMQMLGRVHRTGQIQPPYYSQMMADIPAEMRPAAVLLKKMASLNANTTASRKSAVTAEGAVDFMNEYGGQVAQEFLNDNPDIYKALGGKKLLEISDNPSEADEKDIRKLTGYIPILPIKEQEEIYKDLVERYNDLIERENSMGTNKLEAKAVDLDAETLSSTPITESKGDSLFAQPAYMEQLDVKRTVKPFLKTEVQELVKDSLDNKTPSEFAKDMFSDFKERSKVFANDMLAKLKESGAEDVQVEEQKGKLNLRYTKINSILNSYKIGAQIQMKDANVLGGAQIFYGVITNIENKKKTKDPTMGSDWKMTIALANGESKSTSINFSQINEAYTLTEENTVNWYNPETQKGEYIQLLDLFDKGATVRREKRWMVTGNILSGFASPVVENQGQIITYTKSDGTTGQGVLMPRTYDFAKAQSDAPTKIKSADDAIKFLIEANGTIGTADKVLQITGNGKKIQFNVPSSKKDGGIYYLDSRLTNLLGDFYKSYNFMYASTYEEEIAKKVIDYLINEKGDSLIALTKKEEAKKLFSPIIPTNNIPTNNISFGEVAITPSRLRNLMSSFAYTMDDSRTKAYIAYIAPDDFIKATSSEEREQEIVKRAGKLKPSELEKEPQSIYLVLKKSENFNFYNIVGHEGRHRMAALRKAGITKVPVVLDFGSAINDAQPIKQYEYIAKQFDVNGRNGFSLKDEALPISYKYRKQILEKYGNEQAEYIYNINFKPNEKVTAAIKRIHDEQIAEYKKLRQRSAHIMKKVAKGEVTIGYQRELSRLLELTDELKQDIKLTTPKNDTPEHFMKKAFDEFSKGNISEETLNVIRYLYDRTPALLTGIKLSVRKNETGSSIGNYNTFSKLVTLYKGLGTNSPVTIRHELMHTLENMMTPQTRDVIIDSWKKALDAAIKKNTDAVNAKYFKAVLDFIESPTKENFDIAASLCPNMDMYQYINPSEYWAVNAERLFATKMGTPWHRFVQFVKQLFEGLKSVFGFNNQYPIYKAFNQLIKGETPRSHNIMLVDYLTQGKVKLDFINNIKTTEDILKDRPDAPLSVSGSNYDKLMGGMKEANRIGKNMLTNPKQAAINLVGNVDRVVLAARIKTTDFTAGLTAADAEKHGRMLEDSQGRAVASVAMNQALRATRIGTQVILDGMLAFDPNEQMFAASKSKYSMANVIDLKHKLENRIGRELSYKAIQAYFEAKRSRSIVNEYLKREGELEDLRTEQMDPATSVERQLTLLNKIADAELGLRNIKIALDKVNLTDEEIDKYSDLEKLHPELRQMMDNWGAVNKNMVDNMELAKMISKQRAQSLREIEDYVPWNRIMDDQEDVHSASWFRPATPKFTYGTKAVRNVSREQRFEEGKVDLDIDDIVDNMIHNVMVTTRNVIKNYAANRIAQEYGVRNENGKLKVFPQEDHSKGIIKILVNGRKVNIQIADPLVAQAAIGIESIQVPMGTILSFFANGLRRAVTISPAFQAKQVFMDAPTAMLVTGVKNPLALWTKVFSSALKSLNQDDFVIKILKARGIGGFTSTARTAEQEFKQEMGLLNQSTYAKITKLLDRIGDASDYSQRRAVFMRKIVESGGKIVNGKVVGGDMRAALLAATNVIDFEKRGNSATAQFLNRTISFMNAFAQQIDVLTQALMEVPAAGIEKLTGAKITSVSGNLKGLDRQQAITRLTVAGLGLSATVLLYCYAIGDDDEYNKMDDQTKMRNFVIPKKLMKEVGYDHTLLIPMHTSASYLFKSIPEMLFNQITKEGTKDAVDNERLRKALHEGLIDAFAGPLGSGPVPTGLKPLAEIKLNRNFFTGGRITPRGMENLAAFEQYNAATSELGKWLSSVTGGKEKRLLNPMEADHLMRGLGGTVAATAMWMSNALGNNRPMPEERSNPLYGSFVAPDVPRGREDLFYDLKQRTEVAMATYRDLMKNQKPEEAKLWYKDHVNEIKAYGFTQQAGKELADINSNIRRIEKLPESQKNAEQKRADINNLKLTKERILEQTIRFRLQAEQKPSP